MDTARSPCWVGTGHCPEPHVKQVVDTAQSLCWVGGGHWLGVDGRVASLLEQLPLQGRSHSSLHQRVLGVPKRPSVSSCPSRLS